MPFEWTGIIGDHVLHGEAAIETNGEGYEGLVGEAHYRREANEDGRAAGEVQPPLILPACAMLVCVEIAIPLKPIGKVSKCQWLTNCLGFFSV